MYLQAQRTIQAAFRACDDQDASTRELLDVILFAASTLIAVERGNETRKDIRAVTERGERLMWLTAEALQSVTKLPELLAHFGSCGRESALGLTQ